jgi:uncharacterized protein YjbI with pentapeptide repeats
MSVKFLFALVATVAVCLRAGAEPAGKSYDASRTSFLYAADFSEHPDLKATAKQRIVFDSNWPDAVVRFSLPGGTHRFCLNSAEEYFTGLKITRDDHQVISARTDRAECLRAELTGGTYEVTALHEDEPFRAGDVALLTIDPPGPPVVNKDGSPRGGYWGVISIDANNEPRLFDAKLRTMPGNSQLERQVGGRPVISDYLVNDFDGDSLFRFDASGSVLLGNPDAHFQVFEEGDPKGAWGTVIVQRGSCVRPAVCPAIKVLDRKEASTFTMTLSDRRTIVLAPTRFSPRTLYAEKSQEYQGSDKAIFSLALRFFPDAADMDQLQEGEVALFQASNYLNGAAVFSYNTNDLSKLSSSLTTIDRNTSSVKLGHGTFAKLYSGARYTGESITLERDTQQLQDPNVRSIRIGPLLVQLLHHRNCENCDFEGVDLSGLNLSGMNLRGVRLRNADLRHSKLSNANLQDADLSGARLLCTNFSGKDGEHLNDLTHTNLIDVKIERAQACKTDFSFTQMVSDVLRPTDLAKVRLEGTRYKRAEVGGPAPGQGAVSGPPLVVNGAPVPGYWAIQPDPALDPQQRLGRLRATPPFANLGAQETPSDAWVQADYTSQEMDGYSLFAFPPNQNTVGSILGPPSGTFLNGYPYGENEMTAIFLTVGHGYACGQFCTLVNQRLTFTDLGNYQFNFGYYSWWVNSGPFFIWSGGPGPSNAILDGTFPGDPPATKFRVMFRFFPDGTQVGNLAEGEVAIFQQPNFQGKAAVFIGDPNGIDLDALTSDVTTLVGTVNSIRLGSNTAVAWGECQGGCDHGINWVGTVTNMSSGVPNSAEEHRIYVQPLDQAIQAFIASGNELPPAWSAVITTNCTNCNLVNSHFSGVSFAQWNFSGAVLSGATLTNVSLGNAVLTGAHLDNATLTGVTLSANTHLGNNILTGATLSNVTATGTDLSSVSFTGATLANTKFSGTTLGKETFSGAKVSCVDFSGPDAQHLVDLTALDFSTVQWLSTAGCRTNFSYTKLSVKQVPPTMWKSLNLTGAVFVDLPTNLSSQTQPLDLSGAILAQMSLQNVVLDYALMNGVDLTQANLTHTSLQHTDLSSAFLYSATLTGANLDGANLYGAFLTKTPGTNLNGAVLQGAFLRNVNLASSRLSGADFSNSSFFGVVTAAGSPCTQTNEFTNECASAHGALMEDTDFEGAFLAGTDFSNTNIVRVRFGNATLTGASFQSATIQANPTNRGSEFSKALIQGTDFTNAVLSKGISFADAFVDFTPGGNTFVVELSGAHTNFAGYWSTPGADVCTKVFYKQGTVTPITSSADQCPNHYSYASGCGPASVDGSNLNWKSTLSLAGVGSYASNSTYTPASDPVCTVDPKWSPTVLETAAKQIARQR